MCVCALGSQVFVKEKDHLWCRGAVLYLSQKGQDDVTSCPAHLLTCARIFLMDYGVTKTIYLDRCTHTHTHCHGYRFDSHWGYPHPGIVRCVR